MSTSPGTVQYTQLGNRWSVALLASPQDGRLSVATVSLPLVYYSGGYPLPANHPSTGPACSLSLRRGRPQWYPDLAQARRGAEYIGRQGRTPEKCHTAGPPAVPALHVRSYKSGPGAARPLIQKRRMDRAHSAPVLAVHVDVRPPPGVSIDTPLLLRPIASMQVCAAGVDRPYPFFLLLLSLLARAGDTGGIEQTGQNHETMGTLERPTQSG